MVKKKQERIEFTHCPHCKKEVSPDDYIVKNTTKMMFFLKNKIKNKKN